MPNGTKFTESQLRKLGFAPSGEGVAWGKEDSRAASPGPSSTNVEPSSRRQSARAMPSQGGRKKPGAGSSRFVLVVHSFRTRLIDSSHAYLKALEDALVMAGIIPDDSPAWCDPPIFLQTKVKAGQEKTILEVWEYA